MQAADARAYLGTDDIFLGIQDGVDALNKVKVYFIVQVVSIQFAPGNLGKHAFGTVSWRNETKKRGSE